jgi:hypothetical protein
MVYELESRNRQDVLAARELLRRILKNGRIVLDPQPDRVYLARTEVLPLLLLSEGFRETGSPWVSPGAAFSSACSGGLLRQLDLAISLGIEVRLVA